MGYPSGVMGCDVVSTHVSVADYAPKDLGVLMRLYYPTERAPPFFKLFRPRWEPSVSYAAGRAHFLFNFNERPWWFKLLAKILYTGQHIASFETIPASLDAPPASRGLPVIVFSHGLSGCRNMYSALCTSLAARGYMVAAIEHRDGSASCCATVAKDGKLLYQRYVHTDGNFCWRQKQLQQRVKEVGAVVAAMRAAAPRGAGAPSNCYPRSGFNPALHLDGFVDCSCLTLIGHSFGGATVISAAGSLGGVKRIVLLDPWVEPFGPCPPNQEPGAHPLTASAAAGIPTLAIISDRWGAELHNLFQKARAPWFLAEVSGTKHQDFSDLPFRLPVIASMIRMKGTADTQTFFAFQMSLIQYFFSVVERGTKHLTYKHHEEAEKLIHSFTGQLKVELRTSHANE
tara:strand:+ start:335 stop:1534 length:1200 start_codon:yes stop_codon:yes gene_type:complete